MVVTRAQLQQLIDEEFERAVMARGQKKGLNEGGPFGRSMGGGDLWDIDASTLLDFARSYASLGSVIQDQIDVLMDGDTDRYNAEVSGGGVIEIQRKLGGINEEIDEALASYDEWLADERHHPEEDNEEFE